MMTRVDATIQARTGSSRLPGKVLRDLDGKPLLQYQIERIQQSRRIDRIILATTDRPQDDALASLAESMGIGCFRGSEDDVIARVCGALRAFDVDVHAEFMGDNSIPDANVIDHVIDTFFELGDSVDYVTNALKTTYPPGLEVSVYRAATLFDAESKIVDGDIREYCGFHIYTHPERYRIVNVDAPEHQRRPHLHLEVDTEEDFQVVASVYRHFTGSMTFTLDDVIAFADSNPELFATNARVERRWKQYRQDED